MLQVIIILYLVPVFICWLLIRKHTSIDSDWGIETTEHALIALCVTLMPILNIIMILILLGHFIEIRKDWHKYIFGEPQDKT